MVEVEVSQVEVLGMVVVVEFMVEVVGELVTMIVEVTVVVGL